jgi:hypothetical protein
MTVRRSTSRNSRTTRSRSRRGYTRRNGAHDREPLPIRISGPDGSHATLQFGASAVVNAIERAAEFDHEAELGKARGIPKSWADEIDRSPYGLLGDKYVSDRCLTAETLLPRESALLTLSVYGGPDTYAAAIRYLVSTAEQVALAMGRTVLCIRVFAQEELLEIVPAGYNVIVYPSGQVHPDRTPTAADRDSFGEPYIDLDPYFSANCFFMAKLIKP